MEAALKILMYHGIVPDSTRNPVLRFGQLGVGAFERQLRWLSRFAHVVPLPHALNAIAQGRALPRRTTVLTFDDGLRSNAEIAVPLLRRFSLPATFFVATDHIGTGRLLWFNRLAAEAMVLEPGAGHAALRKLLELRDTYSAGDAADVVASRLGLETPRSLGPEAALLEGMTKDQLRTIARDQLFEIGGHSVTHPSLPMCQDARLKAELEDSRALLQDVAGRPISCIAYPQGMADQRVVHQVREAGFDWGLAVRPLAGVEDGAFNVVRTGIYEGGLGRFMAKCLTPSGWKPFARNGRA